MSIPVVFPSVERTYLTDKYACWWMAYHVPLNITRLHSMILTTLVVYRIQNSESSPKTNHPPPETTNISVQLSSGVNCHGHYLISVFKPATHQWTDIPKAVKWLRGTSWRVPAFYSMQGVQVHMGHMHIHAVVPKQQFPMHHATCILTYIFTYIQPVQTISAMSMVWLG